MSFFRGAKKLMVGVGLASGCAGLAMHMLVGTEQNNRIAQASTVTDYKLFDHLSKNVHEFCSTVTQSQWDFDWDKREPASLVKPLKNPLPNDEELKKQGEKLDKARPHVTRNLILIRHGQYDLKGTCDEERKLTSLGQEQAEFTGLRLKELSLPYSKIIQSSMTRAKETASIISKHLPDLPIQSCDFLREGSPIKPVPESPNWRPEAKQFHEDGARIEAAFRRYFHRASPSQAEDSYEILACHANVIRYFICRALQFPPEAWLRFSLHNCSITWIAIRPSGRVVVYSVGDIGHMPPSVLTTT